MVSRLFHALNDFVCNCFLQTSCVKQGVLSTIAFGYNSDNSQYFSIFMCSFLGLQSDGVIDRLISCNLVRRNIHETDRFGSCDNCSYLFIDRETFHLFVGLLCKLKDILSAADFTMVNLEGALTAETAARDKDYRFRAPPEYAAVLTCGGVDA